MRQQLNENDVRGLRSTLRVRDRRIALLEEVLENLMDAPVMGLVDTDEYLRACVLLGKEPAIQPVRKT